MSRGRRARDGAAGVVLAVVLLVAGCSAGADDASSVADVPVHEVDGEAFAASEDVQADDAQAGGEAASVGTAVSADAAGRQVITTGDVALVADDPLAAADAVVRAVTAADGRVDGRQESTSSTSGGLEGDAPVGGDGSWARLTVRVPADQVTSTVDALDAIGTVATLDIRSEDVTGTAQDLDARIRATQISVTRLEDLLSRAGTSADVIAAEQTLSERQSTLEQLESERARLSEQVALSTLTISITTDPVVVEEEAEPPSGFLDGLAAGWDGLLTVLRVALVVLGAVLPWAVLAGLVLAVVLAVRRWLRGRRGPVADAEPVPVPVLPEDDGR